MVTEHGPHGRTGGVDAALLILRLALGVVFVAHGAQKLFQFGLAGTTAAFEDMGIFLPSITAPVVSLVEFLGGMLLVVGLFSRIAAVAVACIMLGAMLMVHLPSGFFLPNGIEFTFMNFAVAVALAVTGPGAFSLDAKREGSRSTA